MQKWKVKLEEAFLPGSLPPQAHGSSLGSGWSNKLSAACPVKALRIGRLHPGTTCKKARIRCYRPSRSHGVPIWLGSRSQKPTRLLASFVDQEMLTSATLSPGQERRRVVISALRLEPAEIVFLCPPHWARRPRGPYSIHRHPRPVGMPRGPGHFQGQGTELRDARRHLEKLQSRKALQSPGSEPQHLTFLFLEICTAIFIVNIF